ncbi:MAG: endonuclease III [Spirochaetales bacterium]|nr:endonuclease III [Spirochaetales bacterium]
MDPLHDFDRIVAILKQAYDSGPTPSVTLISNTLKDPYHVLVSTIISLRTKDQVTLTASERLFAEANDVFALQRMEEQRIAELIYPAGFYKTKAGNLKKIADILISDYNGQVPDSIEEMLKLPGVGRKTANLVMILGFDKPGMCVDTHVHTIANRLGWVTTNTPDKTEFALRDLIPQKYWKILNDYLVSFGQRICVPVSPFCSQCGLNDICRKVGVKKSR